MGRITKPCPACKTTTYRREADGICTECERLIWEAKQNREALAKAQAESGMEKLYQEPWFWPHFHRPGRTCMVDPDFDRLNQIFTEMMQAAGRIEVTGERNWDAQRTTWHHAKTFEQAAALVKGRDGIRHAIWLKPEFAKLLAELDHLIRRLVKSCYQVGLKEGQSLLVGLAAGTMSLTKFDEEVESRFKKP
jgi:hypothetical protein